MTLKSDLQDFLIVGQGIAGTVLAQQMMDRGLKVVVIDNGHRHSSTIAAAGIINPITGRYYAKSWMIDELLPIAKSFYHKQQQELNTQIVNQTEVYRRLFTPEQENKWFSKMDQPAYQSYMDIADIYDYTDLLLPSMNVGRIRNVIQVNVKKYVTTFRKKYRSQIVIEEFDHKALQVGKSITYKGLKARNIVFAEGYRGMYNPLFHHDGFKPVKGEALIIKIRGFNTLQIVRDKIFICPIDRDIFWVGAGYDHHHLDEKPSLEEKERLEGKLRHLLNRPFEILDHVAGVRPSSVDRRPIIGRHDKFDNVYLFNGMGTKGTSLAPYWSEKLLSFIRGQEDLPAEVNWIRFIK